MREDGLTCMFLWAPYLVFPVCATMRKRSGRRPDVYSTSGVSNNQYAKEEVVISPWERDEGFGRKPLGRDQNFLLLLFFSRSFMSDSAIPWTAACQLSLSSSISRICWNLCPLSQWCYVNISSSAAPFSCPQSFPASGSFPVSRLFTSGGQKLELQFQHQSFQWIFRVEFSARKSVIVWEGRERIPGVSRGAASWDLHLSWEGVSSEESWDKGTLVNFTTLIVKKLFFKKDDDNNMMKKKGIFNGS